MGELGLSWTPSADTPLTIDLSVQGYTGIRQGYTASLWRRRDTQGVPRPHRSQNLNRKG